MVLMTKPFVVAAITAFQFNAFSSAEKLIFTIQDGQLIFPLATPVSDMNNDLPCGISSAAVGAATSYSTSASKTRIIDVHMDGQTCPDGSESAAAVDGTCAYGHYVGDRKISNPSKCCFVTGQNVFLLSIPGGEKHLKAKYKLDSRTCCTGDEEGTALIDGKCEYGNAILPIPSEYTTRCCWNTGTKEFQVHLEQFEPTLKIDDLKFHTSGQARNSFCNLGYKIDVKGARIYGDRVELDVFVNVDCGTYNHTSGTSLRIYLSTSYRDGGRLTYVLDSFWGPTVYVDLSSKVNSDKSVDIHGRITGTGVLGRLEEGFSQQVDDKRVKDALAWLPLC